MSWFQSEKPVFVHNQKEFLSIWALGHAWDGLAPEATEADNVPASVQAHMDMLMLAYFRKELGIRKADGYRLIGHHWLQTLFGLDKEFNRLWDQLSRKKPFNKAFLDQLYLMRSEVLRWCEKEFREPPACWIPQGMKSSNAEPTQDESDDNDGWYEKLTGRRKTIVAGLEVAKALWKRNDGLTYEEVYRHPAMTDPGFHKVFSFDRFKAWSRPFAPEKAKTGGKRPQSSS